MDCLECERLNKEEAEGAINLVATDRPVSPEASLRELEIQKARKLAAQIRWKTARERLAAHQAAHQAAHALTASL
jgi:hypothetical protein